MRHNDRNWTTGRFHRLPYHVTPTGLSQGGLPSADPAYGENAFSGYCRIVLFGEDSRPIAYAYRPGSRARLAAKWGQVDPWGWETILGSSTLAGIGWKSNGGGSPKGVLRVEFTSGTFYEYTDVSGGVKEQILLSPSKGRVFNELVKRPGFLYRKLQGRPEGLPLLWGAL